MCNSNQLRSVVSLFLLLIFPMGWMCSVTQLCLTLWDPVDYSLPGSSVHGDSPGKNTGVGCHALLQGIFPTQGLDPGLLHCRQILHHLSHHGSPFPMAEPVQFLVKCDLIHFILLLNSPVGSDLTQTLCCLPLIPSEPYPHWSHQSCYCYLKTPPLDVHVALSLIFSQCSSNTTNSFLLFYISLQYFSPLNIKSILFFVVSSSSTRI